MSWVIVIWSAGAGACLSVAFMHLAVWCHDREARANLVFTIMAVAVVVFSCCELALMRAATPDTYGQIARWIHVPVWVIIVGLVLFVRLYLRAGRAWLGWTIIGLRTVSLILNFLFDPNLNYREITNLLHVPFLGEMVAVGIGKPNPWMLVAQLVFPLLIIFVADAAVTAWRRGDRRQAAVIGGSILYFVVGGTIDAIVVTWRLADVPLTASLFYQGIVAAMACELGHDVLRAARLTRRLRTTEAALHESEARFRIAANSAPVLMWMSGVDKLCVFFNKAWLEFTGRPIEQEVGDLWSEGVYPEDLEQCLNTYSTAFDARDPFTMQYRLRRHDGEYRWITDHGVPRYDDRGQFAGYIGACVDITELRRKEQALREVEDRVKLAADAAQLGVWEFNTTTNRLWVSDNVRALFQFPPEVEVTLADFQSRVHPNDRALREMAIQQAINSQGNYEIEYQLVLPDGTRRWMSSRARCVKDARGERTRLVGVSADITQRRHAQELFRLAAEASPSGILLVNGEGHIVLVNAQMEELFGYRRDELIGRQIEILVPERFTTGHPILRAGYFAKPEKRMIGVGRELFARRKDGSEFPVEIGLNPIQTPEGILVLASVVDISARKQAEEEVRQRREEVSRLTRISLLGEMAGSIAHEVNQPLGAIMANANAGLNYMDRGRFQIDQLREILTDIVSAGGRARDVIDNVRATIKGSSAVRQQIALNDVVEKVLHMMQPDAAAISCELKPFLSERLPPVDGDPIQIQQVLINLLGNAFDAMRATQPGMRKVEITTELDGEQMVRVSVRDYGTGLTDNAGQRLFEQFYTTKDHGLGLGLAIVRSIIEGHAGTIAAENAQGGGARFAFTLPTSNGSLE